MIDYIVCQKPGQFLLKQKAVPPRNPGEALLRVERVGICGTDLHAYSGNQAFFSYPRILGHELSATIMEIEDHPELKAGDPVVVMPYVSCGHCFACRNKKTNCCCDLQVLGVHTNGGMQEFVSLPTELLIPAPGLSLEEMAIVEPLAIGAHAVRRAQIIPGEFTAVIGCGPIGLGIMKFAQIAGAKVIALDVNPQRLQYAYNQLGVDHVIQASPEAESVLMELTNNDMASVVFDATGHRLALESGPRYLAHGGRYVLVGLSKNHLSFNHPQIHAKETSILCSRNATIDDFDRVISVLADNLFPTQSFITHTVPFNEMIDHFDQWIAPDSGVIKAMVSF